MHDDSSPLKMGPVIGGTGDVNVTNVVNTEKDAECAKCGTHCTKGQFSTCQGCRKTFCNLHFNRDLGLCPFCESSKEKSSEAEFLSFLKKTVSDDNKMSGPELIKLKKEGTRLGLEASEINLIIKEFQNKGLQGTTQYLIESARKLYEMGQITEASERLAKFSDEELLEQPDLLDLYLRIQAVMNPNKLIRFIEEWPVESVERYVAEFCVLEDRVEARSVLYALRDRKQDDLFSAERIQICWHLSELEENLQLAAREKLLEISTTIKEKVTNSLPAHQTIFQDLCDILEGKEFSEQPTTLTGSFEKHQDSIALRAAKICKQAWTCLKRSVQPTGNRLSIYGRADPSLPGEKSVIGVTSEQEALWREYFNARQLAKGQICQAQDEWVTPENLVWTGSFDPKSKICLSWEGSLREITQGTSLGRDFFGESDPEFGRFMDVSQFKLLTVRDLNATLWGIPNPSWSGWMIVPNIKVSNCTNLNGKPLLIPQPLIGPVELSLGKTGKCKIRLECQPL